VKERLGGEAGGSEGEGERVIHTHTEQYIHIQSNTNKAIQTEEYIQRNTYRAIQFTYRATHTKQEIQSNTLTYRAIHTK